MSYFQIKTYRISFIWNAKTHWMMIQAISPNEAISVVQQQYPGATTFSWWEMH